MAGRKLALLPPDAVPVIADDWLGPRIDSLVLGADTSLQHRLHLDLRTI